MALHNFSIVEVHISPDHTIPCMTISFMRIDSVIPLVVFIAIFAASLETYIRFNLSFLKPESYKSLLHSFNHKESKRLNMSYTPMSAASLSEGFGLLWFIIALITNKFLSWSQHYNL